LEFLGHRIKHIGNPMIPTALLSELRILFTECRPQAQMPIGNRALPGLEPPLPKIA
jgi:hypothetical protein